MLSRFVWILALLCAVTALAQDEADGIESETKLARSVAPDLREDETKFKLQNRELNR